MNAQIKDMKAQFSFERQRRYIDGEFVDQPDYETEYAFGFAQLDGKTPMLHYRGYTIMTDWSTCWGDEIDGAEYFICRTSDIIEAINEQGNNKWTVMGVHHPSAHCEKGYKLRVSWIIPDTDRMIAEAEENLENSDLSEEAKNDVRATWESFGWYQTHPLDSSA
jgi:hypothetical protein